MSKRYQQSELMLDRALKSIPLGSQTFSKSKTQYPYGVSPYFACRGIGSHIWDVDDNEYIDFVSALGAVILGYNDPQVNAAVIEQLQQGVTFSLPHPLESMVAEKLIELVPAAEMVRFGKNGSDATAGAIRLARAYTGRDHVAVCGYHGWQDWYIGSTARNLGVPQVTCALTHSFVYNQIESLQALFKQYPDQIAAVIMEPMNVEYPQPNFLDEVRDLSHEKGAVLIFDEMVTGFRMACGGGGEYFGVVPDLATFGKGMSNGFPLSAIVGRESIMALMEEVFFSFTFGGETLSLAAALATMNKFEEFPVVEHLASQGEKIMSGIKNLLKQYQLEEIIKITGHPSCSFLAFGDYKDLTQWDLKTLFLQETLARGILTIGSHNMNYSHGDADIEELLRAYNEVLAILRRAVDQGEVKSLLRCEVLQPLFKIRG